MELTFHMDMSSKARRISMVGTTNNRHALRRRHVEKTPVGKVGALQSNLDAPAEGEGRRQANFLAAQLGAPRVAEACGFPRSEVWDRLH